MKERLGKVWGPLGQFRPNLGKHFFGDCATVWGIWGNPNYKKGPRGGVPKKIPRRPLQRGVYNKRVGD